MSVAQPPEHMGIAARVGALTLAGLRWLGRLGFLAGDTAAAIVLEPFRGRPVRRPLIAAQAVLVGVKSLPVVLLVLFFVGLVLALQLSAILQRFGAVEYVGSVVGVAVTRELGPLMAAIVFTGFAGAAMAAELGTMKVGEEIDAMVASALSPVRFLVAPRALACFLMVPAVTVLADVVGILGGVVVTAGFVGVAPQLYFDRMFDVMTAMDVWTGIIKSGVFGLVIALVACLEGLSVRGGAAGVGRATTRSVVIGIVAIIVVDCFFAGLFYLVEV
jgi:phospholipid/cholesterol/gamma-HCH transport system permease protein